MKNTFKENSFKLLSDNMSTVQPWLISGIDRALQTEGFVAYLIEKKVITDSQRAQLSIKNSRKTWKHNDKVAKHFIAYELQDKTSGTSVDTSIFRAFFNLKKHDSDYVMIGRSTLSEAISVITCDSKKSPDERRVAILELFKNEQDIFILAESFLSLFEEVNKQKIDVPFSQTLNWMRGKKETNGFANFIKEIKQHAKDLVEKNYLPALQDKEQNEFLEQAKTMKVFEGVTLETKQEVQEKISFG